MPQRKRILQALAEPILACIRAPGDTDSAAAVADEALIHMESVPDLLRVLLGELIDWLGKQQVAGTRFEGLPLDQRSKVVDALIDNENTRDRVGLLLKLMHVVIYSRQKPRDAIRFRFAPAPNVPAPNPVSVAKPAAADLSIEYDVCVVGSGAGGAVVASRLAEEGRRVLLVEEGPWVSPGEYSTRDDAGLRQAYRNAGLHLAFPKLGTVLSGDRLSFLAILQARVVGGGPAVNNAIHLPILESRLTQWIDDYDFPYSFADVKTRLDRVGTDLGVTTAAAERGVGERSSRFRAAATALGWSPAELPVSVLQCAGCGACNLGCRFGRKTGGLHGPRAAGVRSYLHRFLECNTAAIRADLSVKRFHGNFVGNRVVKAVAEDLSDGGREVEIRAKHFVLSAGPIASSKLLIRSGIGAPDYPTGTRIAANVVMPVYAIFPDDLTQAPDPGLEMTVYVERQRHLLETWFHFPGSLAPTVVKILSEHARFMDAYPRLAATGVVVPTGPNGRLGVHWEPEFALAKEELAELKAGIANAAAVYHEAGAVEFVPASAFPVSIKKATHQADLAAFLGRVQDAAALTLSTAHPQGGNPIGKKRRRAVIGPDFRPFGIKGLTVADGSVFPAGCDVNPQMTIMALAHLAADHVSASGLQ